MKYLLVLVVVAVGYAWWRGQRTGAPPPQGKRPLPPPQDMVACAHCGVHLPQGEALTDAGGRAYCSEAHRLAGPR